MPGLSVSRTLLPYSQLFPERLNVYTASKIHVIVKQERRTYRSGALDAHPAQISARELSFSLRQLQRVSEQLVRPSRQLQRVREATWSGARQVCARAAGGGGRRPRAEGALGNAMQSGQRIPSRCSRHPGAPGARDAQNRALRPFEMPDEEHAACRDGIASTSAPASAAATSGYDSDFATREQYQDGARAEGSKPLPATLHQACFSRVFASPQRSQSEALSHMQVYLEPAPGCKRSKGGAAPASGCACSSL